MSGAQFHHPREQLPGVRRGVVAQNSSSRSVMFTRVPAGGSSPRAGGGCDKHHLLPCPGHLSFADVAVDHKRVAFSPFLCPSPPPSREPQLVPSAWLTMRAGVRDDRGLGTKTNLLFLSLGVNRVPVEPIALVPVVIIPAFGRAAFFSLLLVG